MVKKIKSLVQYLLIIGLTGVLLYFSLGALDDGSDTGKFERLKLTWNASDKFFLITMVTVTMISHLIRALRWNMLLKTSGQPVKLLHSFLSLMVGYLVNLVIPRGGEVSRSLNLYKLDAIPVEVSFGTVIVERIIDIIFLVGLILLSFWIEWDKISVFLIGQKKHYMDVPQHVFTMKFEFIVFNFLHIIPAMILAIVFPVKFSLNIQNSIKRQSKKTVNICF